MTHEDIKAIIEPDNFSWIKVKRFREPEHVPDAEDYARLTEHHKKETEFLIAKCRELAQAIWDEK